MTGLGTIINSISIVAGGLIGHFTGKLFKSEQQESLNKACGVSVLFIGMAGAMEGMLKKKTGNSGDASFVNAFVTASLTVSIGAMAIVGAIQDGLTGDYSTLVVKSVLDFIIIVVMTSSMGKGAILTQDKVNLMMSHINSYTRKKLNNRSAHQLFSFFYGADTASKLNLEAVPANEIILKPELLK